jgi:hypothetical protein
VNDKLNTTAPQEGVSLSRIAMAIYDAGPQLDYVLRQFGCPCGARPESLNTHPHVGGCGFDKLLRLQEWAVRTIAAE